MMPAILWQASRSSHINYFTGICGVRRKKILNFRKFYIGDEYQIGRHAFYKCTIILKSAIHYKRKNSLLIDSITC